MELPTLEAFKKYYSEYPFVMADIGASGGVVRDWTRLGKHLEIIGFEPDQREYRNLSQNRKKQNIRYLNTLVSNEKNSKMKFNLYAVQQLSSMFSPNVDVLSRFGKADTWNVSTETEVNVDTLDNQLQNNKIKDLDFLKLDTQGSELMILEGAKDILERSVFGLHIEVEFTPVYSGQPLFSDIDIFLRKYGFQLFEIIRSKILGAANRSTLCKDQGSDYIR